MIKILKRIDRILMTDISDPEVLAPIALISAIIAVVIVTLYFLLCLVRI